LLRTNALVSERYQIERSLGCGGMGEVYAARDRLLNRLVALKVLRDPYARDPGFVARFRQEALAAASLDHPGVVEVYDAPRGGEIPYIAMEFVSGGTLKDLISRKGALGWREAARIATGIARALGAAHARGLVHRDVKPQNVLLTASGEPKLADFGIARAADATRVTATGTILGSVYYISPEQALGEMTSPKSDLYSLGVTLYEMLTGEVPFEAENPIAVAMMHVRDEVPPPSSREPSVPAGMDLLLERLLAKDPADRYAGAEEVAAELERLISSGGKASGRRHHRPGGATAALPHTHGRRSRPVIRGRTGRRRRNGAALLVTLAALMVCAGWWMTSGSSGPADKAVAAARTPRMSAKPLSVPEGPATRHPGSRTRASGTQPSSGETTSSAAPAYASSPPVVASVPQTASPTPARSPSSASPQQGTRKPQVKSPSSPHASQQSPKAGASSPAASTQAGGTPSGASSPGVTQQPASPSSQSAGNGPVPPMPQVPSAQQILRSNPALQGN
jgi:serine/threonine protein kinase